MYFFFLLTRQQMKNMNIDVFVLDNSQYTDVENVATHSRKQKKTSTDDHAKSVGNLLWITRFILLFFNFIIKLNV